MYNFYLIFEGIRILIFYILNISKELKVALIQADLVWENPHENRTRFEHTINSISDTVDVIVLPEMFTTGFTMNAVKLAETMQGTTVLWMQKIAKEKNATILGSIIIKENNAFYNRLLFVFPEGKIETYDKRHTFTLAGEDKMFSAGKSKAIISYKGWKICPLICYDLRFPIWVRNTHNYDVLIYVANWPTPRITAWNALLKARAIENMSYTIGVNRVGEDANEHLYSGHSAGYDCLGNELCKSELKEEILIITLDKESQQKTRKKFGFLDDMDSFIIQY